MPVENIYTIFITAPAIRLHFEHTLSLLTA